MSGRFWLNNWRRGIVQRYLVGVLALLVAALVVTNYVVVSQARAQGEEPAELDPIVYTQVQQLRKELALTNLDLAAMGMTQEQAEGLLQSLLDWYAANQTQLATQEVARRQADRQLRSAYRQIHVGPRNEQIIQQVPTLRATVASARQQRDQLLQPLIAATQSRLTTAQQGVWSAARANQSRPSELRYVGGLQEEQVRTRELTSMQQQQQQAAQENQRQHMPQVLTAENEVMPVPEVLRPQDHIEFDFMEPHQ